MAGKGKTIFTKFSNQKKIPSIDLDHQMRVPMIYRNAISNTLLDLGLDVTPSYQQKHKADKLLKKLPRHRLVKIQGHLERINYNSNQTIWINENETFKLKAEVYGNGKIKALYCLDKPLWDSLESHLQESLLKAVVFGALRKRSMYVEHERNFIFQRILHELYESVSSDDGTSVSDQMINLTPEFKPTATPTNNEEFLKVKELLESWLEQSTATDQL